MIGPVLAGISILTTAVGGGLSYAAQMSGSRTASTFATLNAAAGLQQAQSQGRMAQLQAQMQAAKAMAEQKSAMNNAQAIREQTDMETKVAQENIRKSRDVFNETLANKRAQGAGSGVSDATGSPLQLLVTASEDQAMYEAEQRWADENNRRLGYRRAQVEEHQGALQGLNASLYQLDGMAALAESKMKASQVRLNEFGALGQASGMRNQALGGLIGSIGSIANMGVQMYQMRTPRTAGFSRF